MPEVQPRDVGAGLTGVHPVNEPAPYKDADVPVGADLFDSPLVQAH